MPKLWKRDDGCYFIRGKIHNEDEDNCTWQVDDARHTIYLLNGHGINTDVLPAKFPLTLLIKLKRLGWISTEAQILQKSRRIKPASSSTAKERKANQKKQTSRRVLPPAKSKGKFRPPYVPVQSKIKTPLWSYLSIKVSKLACELGVKPIIVINEAYRRGFKVQSPLERIPNSVAERIREYIRWDKSKKKGARFIK